MKHLGFSILKSWALTRELDGFCGISFLWTDWLRHHFSTLLSINEPWTWEPCCFDISSSDITHSKTHLMQKLL